MNINDLNLLKTNTSYVDLNSEEEENVRKTSGYPTTKFIKFILANEGDIEYQAHSLSAKISIEVPLSIDFDSVCQSSNEEREDYIYRHPLKDDRPHAFSSEYDVEFDSEGIISEDEIFDMDYHYTYEARNHLGCIITHIEANSYRNLCDIAVSWSLHRKYLGEVHDELRSKRPKYRKFWKSCIQSYKMYQCPCLSCWLEKQKDMDLFSEIWSFYEREDKPKEIRDCLLYRLSARYALMSDIHRTGMFEYLKSLLVTSKCQGWMDGKPEIYLRPTDELKEFSQTLIAQVRELTQQGVNINTKFDSVADFNILRLFNAFSGELAILSSTMIFVILIALAKRYPNSQAIGIICGAFAGYVLTNLSTSYLVPLVEQWLTTRPQSLGEDIATLAVEAISLGLFTKNLDFQNLDKFGKTMIDVERQSGSLSKFVGRIKDWIVKTITLLAEHFGFTIGTMFTSYQKELDYIEILVRDIIETYNGAKKGIVPFELNGSFMRLDQVMLDLEVNMRAQSDAQMIRNILNGYRRTLAPIRKMVEETCDIQRPECLIAAVVSHPGTGKTFTNNYLLDSVLVPHLSERECLDYRANRTRCIFGKAPGVPHADGYNGHFATEMNDAFSAAEAAGMESDALFCIQAGGSNNFKLCMAELLLKNKIQFVSKIILLSTNTRIVTQNQFKSLTDIQALIRRLNKVGVYQIVKEMFWDDSTPDPMTGADPKFWKKVDQNKVMAYAKAHGKKVEYDTCRYIPWDFGTGKPLAGGQEMSLDEYIDYIGVTMVQMAAINEAKQTNEAESREELIAKRLEELRINKERIQDEFQAGNHETLEDSDYSCPSDSDSVTTYGEDALEALDFAPIFIRNKMFFDEIENRYRPFTHEEVVKRVENRFDDQFATKEERAAFLTDIDEEYGIHDYVKGYYKSCMAKRIRLTIGQDYKIYFLNDHTNPIHTVLNMLALEDIYGFLRFSLTDRAFMQLALARMECHSMYAAVAAWTQIKIRQLNEGLRNCVENTKLFFTNHPVIGCIIRYVVGLSVGLGITYGIMQLVTKFIGYFIGDTKCDNDCKVISESVSGTEKHDEICEKTLEVKEEKITSTHQSGESDKNDDAFIHARLDNAWVAYMKRTVIIDGVASIYTNKLSTVIFLGGRIAKIHWHSWLLKEMYDKMPNTTDVQFGLSSYRNNGSRCQYWYDAKTIKLIDLVRERDEAIIEIPILNKKENIIKYFPSKRDKDFIKFMHDPSNRIDIKLITKGDIVNSHETRMSYIGSGIEYSINQNMIDLVTNRRYQLADLGLETGFVRHEHSWALDIPTRSGDCGSLGFLISRERLRFCKNNPRMQQPVIVYSHHSLHQSRYGAGSMCYYEDYEKYLPLMNAKLAPSDAVSDMLTRTVKQCAQALDIKTNEITVDVLKPPNTPFEDHHLFVGCLESTNRNVKSAISKSVMYGVNVRTRTPVKLYDVNGVNLLQKTREHCGSNVDIVLPTANFAELSDFVISKIMTESTVEVNPRLLTYEETILGAPDVFLASTSMKTSPGFSLNYVKKALNLKGKGKHWIFGPEDEPDLTTPLAQAVKILFEQAEKDLIDGKGFCNIFGDNLKDELRPPGKDPRLFCAGDLICLLLCKKYMGSFAGWIYANRIRNGIAIGVNPTSTEWDDLYYRLSSVDSEKCKAIFGDFEKFDKKQILDLMMVTLSLMRTFYGGSDPIGNKIRESLFESLVHSLHAVPDGDRTALYEWLHGNTSGNFLTAIINSVSNIMIIFFCVVSLYMLENNMDIFVNTLKKVPLDKLWYAIRIIVYGDDNGITVKRSIVPFVTFHTLSWAIGRYFGLIYTDENKGDSSLIPDYRDLDDCSFISRGFVKDSPFGRPRILSPLKMRSILERPQWDKNGRDITITVAKCEESAKDMAQHGRLLFEPYVAKLSEALYRRTGRYMKFTSYEAALRAVMSQKTPEYYRMWDDEDDEEFKMNGQTFLVSILPRNEGLAEPEAVDMTPIIKPSSVDEGSEESSENLANKANILRAQESAPKDCSPLEVGDALSNSERKSIAQCDNAEQRIEGGRADNEELLNSVACDNQRTTCFTEGLNKRSTCITGSALHNTSEINAEGIEAFLAKPHLLSTFDYTTTSTTRLYTATPHALLTSVTAWNNKIIGWNLIRGTFCLRVEMNAMPFMTGMTIIHALPNVTDILASTNNRHLDMYNKLPVSWYQQPFIELDVNDTVAEFKMPYISPTGFYDMKQGIYTWGQIYIDPLVALGTGSATQTKATISVYGYWEDIELSAPTLPQSNKGDRETKERGPIGSALSSVGKAASALGEIPVLSKVMDSAAWVANGLAASFNFWGWSKPRKDDLNIVVPQPNRYIGTSDGPDVSMPTAVVALNKLGTCADYSITDEDEMSFDFLFKVPHYYTTMTWDVTQATDTSLLGFNTSPGLIHSTAPMATIATHTGTYYQGGPMFYLSNLFAQWRGGFKLRIKFIKNKFYSGKLQVTYSVGQNIGIAATTTNAIYSLRHIIDIREQDEVEFKLPYLCAAHYLNTDTGKNDHYSGRVDIRVLNELKAPDNCATTISALIFCGPGDDFEFQIPSRTKFGCYPFAVFQSDGNERMLEDTGIGNSKIMPLALRSSELCCGEHIRSVKQLLNKNSQWLPTGTKPWAGPAYNFAISPYAVFAQTNYTASGLLGSPAIVADTMSWIAPMYNYMRGGVRFLVTDKGTATTTPLNMTCIPEAGDALSQNTPYATNLTSNGTEVTLPVPVPGSSTVWPGETALPNERGSGLAYAEFPYYSRFPVTFIPFASSTTALNNLYPWGNRILPKTVANIGSANGMTIDTSIYRSCSDDFTLSYFIGCPPVLATYS